MGSIQSVPLHSAQDRINGSLYRRDLVRFYTTAELTPPEAVALVRYREDIQERRVLDLGCGAGRFALYLRPLTGHYVGLDVSEHMVAYCMQHFPDLSFARGDMRSLPFDAGSFDCVLGVYNLFDAVSHADRLRVLAEVRRVLAPGGLLIFSSRNRRWIRAGAAPRLSLTRNPVKQLRFLVDFLQALANRRRIAPHQRTEADYALLNDDGHNYAVLHYFIGRHAQAQQLADAGFHLLECLDEQGRTLGPEADDCTNSSIHYVARAKAPS